jgi:bla regulator protein BlaR1
MTSIIAETALALSGSAELSILGKATLMLLLGLTAVALARRARASVRHLALAATFASLLGLPLVFITVPGVTIAVPVSHAVAVPRTLAAPIAHTQPTLASTPATSALPSVSWPTLIRWAWIVGATLLAMQLAVGLARVRRIRRNGLPWPESRALAQSVAAECGVHRRIEILLHEDLPAPLTFGVWRPAIILPANARHWSDADLQRALVHELEHVRRCDWLSQLTARAVCACYWFHPLVWMAWRRLCLEAERACDDAVVRSAESTEYAEQLVQLARQMSVTAVHPAPGMAQRSDLSARISALLDGNQRRGRAGFIATVSAISVACLLVAAVAPIRAIAQSTTSSTAKQRRHSPLDRALFEAACEGDTSDINALLSAGASVNAVLEGDGTPLIGAARNGRFDTVRMLLDRGADPNLPSEGDGNPLIMAANRGYANVVALLLDRGARIDEMVPGDENALIQASGSGKLEVVKLLVARRADANARVWVEGAPEQPGGEWRSALNMARKGRHDAVVAYLLSIGARE